MVTRDRPFRLYPKQGEPPMSPEELRDAEQRYVDMMSAKDRAGELLVWPATGAEGLLPAGETVFNLHAGQVVLGDGTEEPLSNSLKNLGRDMAHSFRLIPGLAELGVQIEAPEVLAQRSVPPFVLDPMNPSLSHLSLSVLHLYTRVPTTMVAYFSTDPEPFDAGGLQSGGFLRANPYATNASFAAVAWVPVSINRRTGAETLMSASRAAARALGGGTVLEVGRSKDLTILVFNAGAQSLDVNLQGSHRGPAAGDNYFMDDASTGSSTTITTGNKANLQVAQLYRYIRLRARSTAAGSDSTLHADIGGSLGPA